MTDTLWTLTAPDGTQFRAKTSVGCFCLEIESRPGNYALDVPLVSPVTVRAVQEAGRALGEVEELRAHVQAILDAAGETKARLPANLVIALHRARRALEAAP